MDILNAIIDTGSHWDISSYFLYVLIGVVYALLLHGANVAAKRELRVEHILFLFGAAVWFFFFLAFRDISVGSDTRTYILWFQNATTLDIDLEKAIQFQSSVEPLFELLLYLLRQLGDSPVIFTCAEAIIISASLTYFLDSFIISASKPLSTLPVVLMAVYFEFAAAIARSAIGMSLILIALVVASKRRYGFAIVLSILALFMHNTLAIFLPFFLCAKWSDVFLRLQPKKILIVVCFLVALVGLLSAGVYGAVMSGTKYGYYEDSGTTVSIISSWNIVLLILFVAFLLFGKNGRVDTLDSAHKLILCAFLFEIIVLPFVFVSGFWRASLYFLPIRCVVWGIILRKLGANTQDARVRFLLGYFFFLAFQFYILFYLGRESYFEGFVYSFMF